VRLLHDTSARLFERLRSGELDFAIAAVTGAIPHDLTAVPLGEGTMVFVCGPQHRLAERQWVALRDVASETFIDFQADWGVRSLVDRAFESAGLNRDAAYIVNDATYLLRFVERNLAVAVVPDAFNQLHADVRYIHLRPAPPPWQVIAAHLGDQPASAAARALLSIFRDHVRRGNQGKRRSRIQRES
jgi:DNA-binding transcriptional LysR family regulator